MPLNMEGRDWLQSYQGFLEETCGFFVIEYFITQLAAAFYPPAWVEQLWKIFVGRINAAVLSCLGSGCEETGVFMKMKWAQVFFMHALEIYQVNRGGNSVGSGSEQKPTERRKPKGNFPSSHLLARPSPVGSIFGVSELRETLLSLFYRYTELLKTDHLQAIRDAINKDQPAIPMVIGSRAVLERMQAQQLQWLQNNEKSSIDSVSVACSASVYECFQIIGQFIGHFYVFLEGIPQQTSELDDIAKKVKERKKSPTYTTIS